MGAQERQPKKLKPLKISCLDADCKNGLHCFRKKERRAPMNGPCRVCGIDLVDWPRVHARCFEDIQHTVLALKQERVRHIFWHMEMEERAILYARKKGMKGLEERVPRQLKTLIGRGDYGIWEGRQTPMGGKKVNAIHYAQHATATCCRYCLNEWHGIPLGRDLAMKEIQYLSKIVMHYLRERLPDIGNDGTRSIRSRANRPKRASAA